MKSKLSALALSLLLAGSLAVGASAYDDIELTGTNTPPVIDGKLDDCYMKIHDFYEPKEEEWYDNEDFGHDAQGGAWGTWDKDNFYGYFKIAEEDYFPKNVEHEPPGSTYSSMYLALLATPPVNDDPEDPLYVMQCSFNRSIDDTKEWKYTGSVDERYRDNSGAYAKYETCPFDFEVIHEDGFTCYEVAMPWNQIDRTGKVKFTEGHKWTFNYIISWINESGGYNVVQYGQGLMNDIYDMGGIVTLAAAPASTGTAESSEPAAAGAELLAQSWDTIFVDYEMMVDGGAGAWLADNPVEGDIEDLETRGWAHISTPITAFAYTIDGGDPVQSEDFIQDRPDVKAAIHEEAEGFDIQIEVADLGAGDHLIKIYAVDANGGLVDTGFDFPFTLIRDEAPAATGAYPASGESGNFMMGKVIGNETGWDGTAASGAASAFDGDPATFFDPLGVGDGFCGMEYDEPYILEKVAILSRSGWLDRFAGASIEGSNDGEEWETLWESDDVAPSETEYNIVTEFENNYGYKMFRYINWINHGDVAEVEFYGKPGTAERPAEEPKAEEPAPEPEPEPTAAEVVENTAEAFGEAVGEAAENAAEAVENAAEAVSNAASDAAKKSGCGSFIGGGLIVLAAILGSGWISKRK